jgi:hypothetical protein
MNHVRVWWGMWSIAGFAIALGLIGLGMLLRVLELT